MGRRSTSCLSSGRAFCPGSRPSCLRGRICRAGSAGRTSRRRGAASAGWGFPTWWTEWYVRPCGRCSNRCGSRRSTPQATGFDLAEVATRRSRRPRGISRTVTGGAWILIWRGSWCHRHTAYPLLRVVSKRVYSACGTSIRRPFRRPLRTWMASSSSRFTRCNTVWRLTPMIRIASTIGT